MDITIMHTSTLCQKTSLVKKQRTVRRRRNRRAHRECHARPIDESAAASAANLKLSRPPMTRSRSSPVSSFNSPQSPIQERREQNIVAESIPEHHDFAPDPAPAYAGSYRQVGTKASKESFQHPPSYMSREPNGDRAWNAATSDQGSENVILDAPSVDGGSLL